MCYKNHIERGEQFKGKEEKNARVPFTIYVSTPRYCTFTPSYVHSALQFLCDFCTTHFPDRNNGSAKFLHPEPLIKGFDLQDSEMK